jgi:hypothetical protein
MDEAVAPIDVAPLQREEFARPHSGAKPAEDPRVPIGEPHTRSRHEERSFVSGEWLNLGLRLVGRAKVLSGPERGVRRQQFVFDRLCQDRAQGARILLSSLTFALDLLPVRALVGTRDNQLFVPGLGTSQRPFGRSCVDSSTVGQNRHRIAISTRRGFGPRQLATVLCARNFGTSDKCSPRRTGTSSPSVNPRKCSVPWLSDGL